MALASVWFDPSCDFVTEDVLKEEKQDRWEAPMKRHVYTDLNIFLQPLKL